MVKGTIKIPKDSQDCKDGKCGHPHEFPFEIEDKSPEIPSPASITTTTAPNVTGTAQQLVPPPSEPPKEPKLSHDVISSMIPNGVNVMECPGGDCGHKRLKNPNQTKKYKSCPNCEANTLTKNSDFCPYCSKNINSMDLEDGIELEEEEDEDE